MLGVWVLRGGPTFGAFFFWFVGAPLFFRGVFDFFLKNLFFGF